MMQSANSVQIIFSLTAIFALMPALGGQAKPGRQPVARIGDQAIYEEDLLAPIEGQLLQLKNQEYELKIRALTNLVDQRLVEYEAKKQGLSAEAFLEQTVDRNLPAWNILELEGFYLAQSDRINKPLSEVRAQMERAFVLARLKLARQEYIDRLRKKAGVTILLSRPKFEVVADLSRVRGNVDAPVTIVEFADFQCPYCQEVEPSLKAVLDKYQGKVRLAFRDFPINQIHPQAQHAAEASRCAGEQGKFWEYHDLLYAKQEKLDPVSLKDYARTAGLDVERFGACLASGKFKAPIESDVQAGTLSGVTATPAFFIDGKLLIGTQAVSEFETIIGSALAKAASK
jgi:protein-disulfide isomerase